MRRSAWILLAACVCLSTLALGGAHIRVVQIATVLVVACGVLALLSGALDYVPAPAWVLAGLGLYSLIQSIPLPVPALQSLSARAADTWTRALQPLNEHVARGSISLDPGASTLEAAKWLSYAVAFAIATAFGRKRGAAPVISLVCASALLVAIATIAHAVVGATTVFGVYEVKYAKAGWHVGPLLNTNCLAGYCLLGVCCALGLFASRHTPQNKALYGAAIVAMSTVVVISGSRGGFVALLAAIATFWVAYTRVSARARGRALPASAWAALGLGLLAVPAFALMFIPDAWEQLLQRDTAKLKMWGWVIPLIKDFAVFGAGRGAFESAFSAYKPGGDNLIYTHPENIIAQWLSEWGVFVGAFSLLSFIWLLRPSRFGAKRHVAALGALIGVVAMTAQNLVDFSLELFGPTLSVMVLLGACLGQNFHRHRSGFPLAGSRGARTALVLIAAVCVLLAAVRGSSLTLERLDFETRFQRAGDAARDPNFMRAELRAAMLRHPADPTFPRLGGMLALVSGENPLPWITRALELCPVDSRSHWTLAHALRQHGALSQAMLEARLTAEYDPSVAPIVGTTVARWTKHPEDIERAAPLGTPGSLVLYYAAINSGPQSTNPFRASLLRSAARHDPNSVAIRVALADALLATLGSAPRRSDERESLQLEILDQAKALDRLTPDTAEASEVRARLYSLMDQPLEADRVLTARCPNLDDQQQVRCWRALLTAAPHDASRRGILDRAARQLVKAACSLGDPCATALLQAGDAMAQIGDWLGALDYFQRASGKDQSVGSLLRVAEAEMALGRKPLAERALALAAGRASSDPASLRQVDAKRRALLGSRPE